MFYILVLVLKSCSPQMSTFSMERIPKNEITIIIIIIIRGTVSIVTLILNREKETVRGGTHPGTG